MSPHAPRSARGAALLEVMAGLTVLLIGLVGMFHMQMLGVTANQGARAKTRAAALAQDLANALDRQPLVTAAGTIDPRYFNPTVSSSTPTPPAPFGSLLTSSGVSTAAGIYDGTVPANLPAGVIPDSSLPRDLFTPALPLYQRRWTVWQYTEPGSTVPVYVIAVSVVYRESKLPTLREVVVYTQKVNYGGLTSYLATQQAGG